MLRTSLGSIIMAILRMGLCAGIALCFLGRGARALPLNEAAAALEPDSPTIAWMQAVLRNWERVCQQDLRIAAAPLPWIIFYDDSQAWHLNSDQHLLPLNTVSRVTLQFAGRNVQLRRVAHQEERLWVPGRAPIEVQAAQVVSMPYDNDRKSFFIAPLPSRFQRLAGADQASQLNEFFLGLTAHELTHTRQLSFALQQIKRLRGRYRFPESLDDNLIEQSFAANAEYKQLYDKERSLLMSAILTADLAECRQQVRDVLALARTRKERFFVGPKAGYAELEDVFLALEGVAMWVQFKTLRARAAAGEESLQTLGRLSERMNTWSQEEGLGLFLVMDRLIPLWQQRVLTPTFPSPFAILQEAVSGRAGGRAKRQ